MAEPLKCSIVMSTRNKAEELERTLKSIFSQKVPFPYEVIVVDDGSTDSTKDVCKKYKLKYIHLENDHYRNPSKARNMGYKVARGEIVIAQSDDIIHRKPNTIQALVENLKQGEFLIAEVHNYEFVNGIPSRFILEYSGLKIEHPYFFLGALWRTDLYAIGGSDEQFVDPCYDDNWFADCLIHGLGLVPRYTNKAKGYHQSHTHPNGAHKNLAISKATYERKVLEAHATGVYKSSGGPWKISKDKILSQAKLQKEEKKMIPKRMSFFWASETMSWLRYMTLKSFRHFHPDWEMVLYRAPAVWKKTWDSYETQDCDVYHGPDYTAWIDSLDIEFIDWKPPIDELAAAHASDICEWEILSTVGGFYADMDILWVKPLDYEKLCNSDVVFCFSDGFAAIGFFGATPDNPLFATIRSTALSGYEAGKYQNTGAEAIYRLGGIANWGAVHDCGLISFRKLALKYKNLKFTRMKDCTVYPFDYSTIKSIFNEENPVPEDCHGIHWFGGSRVAQAANGILTEENYQLHPCTFTNYAKKILEPETKLVS